MPTYTGDNNKNIFTAPNDGLAWTISGMGGDDILTGGSQNDTIEGGEGKDTINGGAGFDILKGGDGDDTLIDTEGNIDGGAGTDTLRADYSKYDNGAGVHVGYLGQAQIFSRQTGTGILGYSNIEKFEITGTNYADILQGGSGNDILKGGAGNDELSGKGGNDTLDGGFGYDTVVYDGNYADYGISFLSNGDLQVIDKNLTNGNDGTDILKGVEVINFTQGGSYGVVTGTTGNDVLTASNMWSFVFGGNGNDTITGGTGNDTLVGGLGADTLTGGLGADKFVFNSLSEGIDVIKDFSWQQGDKIQILGSSFGATSTSQFSFDQNTGGLFFNAQQFATLENKPAGFLTNADIQIV